MKSDTVVASVNSKPFRRSHIPRIAEPQRGRTGRCPISKKIGPVPINDLDRSPWAVRYRRVASSSREGGTLRLSNSSGAPSHEQLRSQARKRNLPRDLRVNYCNQSRTPETHQAKNGRNRSLFDAIPRRQALDNGLLLWRGKGAAVDHGRAGHWARPRNPNAVEVSNFRCGHYAPCLPDHRAQRRNCGSAFIPTQGSHENKLSRFRAEWAS